MKNNKKIINYFLATTIFLLIALVIYLTAKRYTTIFNKDTTLQDYSISPITTNVIPTITSTTTQEVPENSPPSEIKTTNYYSKAEKLTFSYPTNWKILSNIPTTKEIYDGKTFYLGETFSIQSPDKAIILTWYGGLDGIGGMCDSSLSIEKNGSCPIVNFIGKTEIPNTQLFYAEYIITNNGKEYYPVMALQPKNGLFTNSKDSIVYFVFKGKNNGGITIGFKSGTQLDGAGLSSGTKEQAIEFFSSKSAKEAKSIIMSVHY